MAQPTATMSAIITGLRRGRQPGMADIIETEIRKLGPLTDVPDEERGRREDQRQALLSDRIVQSLIGGQIQQRKDLQDLKNYPQGETLDKNISRAFVAVKMELHDDWGVLPGGDMITTRRRERTFCLLTPASVTDTTVEMLRRYGISAFQGAYPDNRQMDNFLRQISDDVWELLR